MVPKAPSTLGSCSATELHLILTCYAAFIFMFVHMCLRECVHLHLTVCAHARVWMHVCVSEGVCKDNLQE